MSEMCLFGSGGGTIGAPMNKLFPCLMTFALLLALPATAAETKKATAHTHPVATGPKQIAKADDWTAATHVESGQTVCYAFTRAQSSSPAVPGRSAVVLTVTERPSGRDSVAVEAGLTYAPNAAVTMQIDQSALDFYTAGRNAFARDGKAAVAAFAKGSRAIVRSPGPKEVTDTFSLKGFSKAYEAIVKACPAK
jgi:hypothetical protein